MVEKPAGIGPAGGEWVRSERERLAVSRGVAGECNKNCWLLASVFPAPASDSASKLLAGFRAIPLAVKLSGAAGKLALKIPRLNIDLAAFGFEVVRGVFFGLVSSPLGNGWD